MNCPRCGVGKLQPSGRKWLYSVYSVKLYFCDYCKQKANFYFKGEKFSHIIYLENKKEKKTLRKKITGYLKTHNCASVEEIAKVIRADEKEVFNELIKMAKQDIVYTV